MTALVRASAIDFHSRVRARTDSPGFGPGVDMYLLDMTIKNGAAGGGKSFFLVTWILANFAYGFDPKY